MSVSWNIHNCHHCGFLMWLRSWRASYITWQVLHRPGNSLGNNGATVVLLGSIGFVLVSSGPINNWFPWSYNEVNCLPLTSALKPSAMTPPLLLFFSQLSVPRNVDSSWVPCLLLEQAGVPPCPLHTMLRIGRILAYCQKESRKKLQFPRDTWVQQGFVWVQKIYIS